MAIEINSLKEEDEGRKVVYKTEHKMQEGRITSWNDTYVFVDYDNSGRGQATRPEDLEFVYEN